MSKDLALALSIEIDKESGESNLKAFSRAFEEAMTKLGKSPDEIAAFKQLAFDIQTGKTAVDQLDNETKQLYQTWRDGAQVATDKDILGLRAHASIQKEIEETRAAYERIKASGTLTQAELAQAALKTEERVRELKHQTNGWVDSLENAKGSLAALAGSAAGLAMVSGYAIDFESAMADVRKTVDGTDEQVDALASRIKEMTRVLPLTAVELANIAAAGGQLGVPMEKLGQFIELAAKMSTAFNMSVDQASDSIAKLSNVFNIPIEQVEGLGDAINVLGNTTAAKEADILDVLTRIGGTANQFKLTATQSAALAATMLEMGATAEVAGTGINAMLSKLQTANIQGPEFQRALGRMGVSAIQLAKDIHDNPQQALMTLLQTLSQLDGQSRAEVLSQLFGQEYQDDIARLLNGLGKYESALSRVADAGKTAGAMQAEFAQRMKTTEAELALMKNGLQEIGINLGTIFLPAIRAVASTLGDAAGALASFVEANPAVATLATSLATMATSMGALRLLMLSLRIVGVKAFADISKEASVFNTSLTEMHDKVGKLGAAMRIAGGIASAAWIGWDIGTQLSKEFLVIEQLGISLVAGLVKLAERAKFAWEVITSPTDYEGALARLEQRLQAADGIFTQMFQDAATARDGVKQGTEALTQSLDAASAKAAVAGAAIKTSLSADITSDASAAFERLGLDIELYSGRVSAATVQAVQDISQLPAYLESAGVSGAQAADALQQAFVTAFTNAKSAADSAALDGLLAAWEQQGLLTSQAIEQIRQSVEKLKGPTDSLEQRMAAAGITTQNALNAAAASAKQLWLDVKAGNKPLAEQQQAFGAYAKAALAANKNVADGQRKNVIEQLKVVAASLGMVDVLNQLLGLQQQLGDQGEQSGEQIRRGADQGTAGLQQLNNETNNVAQNAAGAGAALAGMFNAASESMGALSEAARAAFEQKMGAANSGLVSDIDALKQSIAATKEELGEMTMASQKADFSGLGNWIHKLNEAHHSTKIAFQEQKLKALEFTEALQSSQGVTISTINAAKTAMNSMNLLGKEDLSTLQSALDSANQKLKAMNDNAQSTLSGLQSELDRLQGNQNAIDKRDYENKRQQLNDKLEEARKWNNQEAVRSYTEALRVLDQVRNEKANKAREEAQQKAQREASAQAKTAASTEKVKTVEVKLGASKVNVLAKDEAALLDMLADLRTRS